MYPLESLFVRAAKFIGFSAISQSCRPCSGRSSVCSIILLLRSPFLARARPETRPRLLTPPLAPAETLLDSFGNFPIFISARYYIKNSKLASLSPREFSLSYKGFAATYNISPPPPPFACHFALPRHPLSPICRTLYSPFSSIFLSFSLFLFGASYTRCLFAVIDVQKSPHPFLSLVLALLSALNLLASLRVRSSLPTFSRPDLD